MFRLPTDFLFTKFIIISAVTILMVTVYLDDHHINDDQYIDCYDGHDDDYL